ncbi:MAG TPA: beta-propeller fold lactonase family protein, partial [Kribbella sp.]|nr:beta-propeller fold lactonase family protein [Kribbella sp.]
MSITRRALLGFSAAIVPIHHRVTQEPLRREGSGAGGTMYLGTYGNGIGIATYDAEGRITKTGTIDVPDPSFVIRTGNFLYAVNEQETGAVTAIDISATPRMLNRQPTKGSGACHLTKIGHHLLTANYGSGDIAVHPINPDGSLGQQTDLVPHEGSAPHAHQVVRADEYVLSVDLGTDTIYTYTLATGKLTLQHQMNLPPGTGPRH